MGREIIRGNCPGGYVWGNVQGEYRHGRGLGPPMGWVGLGWVGINGLNCNDSTHVHIVAIVNNLRAGATTSQDSSTESISVEDELSQCKYCCGPE